MYHVPSEKTGILLKEPAFQPLIYRINLMHKQRQKDVFHFHFPFPSRYYRNPLVVFIHSGEGDRGPNRCQEFSIVILGESLVI